MKKWCSATFEFYKWSEMTVVQYQHLIGFSLSIESVKFREHSTDDTFVFDIQLWFVFESSYKS